jgi:hypothetical protein
MGWIVKWKLSGKWIWLAVGCFPQIIGMKMAPSDSNWARPSVATVSIRRGERENRRMTASSTSAPTSSEPTRPTDSASR